MTLTATVKIADTEKPPTFPYIGIHKNTGRVVFFVEPLSDDIAKGTVLVSQAGDNTYPIGYFGRFPFDVYERMAPGSSITIAVE